MLDPRQPGPDYTLQWPRELLVYEAKVLDTSHARSQPGWTDQVVLLLEEAFVSDQPGIDFQAGDFVQVPAIWPDTKLEAAVSVSQLASEIHQSRQEQFLHHLIRAAVHFREQGSLRPYYPARNGPTPPGSSVKAGQRLASAKQAWAALVNDLLNRGYLDRTLTRPCVDAETASNDQVADLDTVLSDRLSGEHLWRKTPDTWSEDEFFGMVEVVHDLVARPRHRRYHSYGNCGWHYSVFAVYPAQILYRWTVNPLLRRHGLDLELAKSGEDVGRLIHTPADDRADLLQRLAEPQATGGPAGDSVAHATALFRSRTATREDKRSACIALAGVLETRRTLLKTELLSGDEGALFQIANQFDVRHRKADQRSDYDDAYLDWLFWWYLATIDLTNQILARQATPVKHA